MTSLKKVFNRQLYLVLSAIWLSATPVHADDTEIYFVEAKGGGQANILFLMDTSGSMGWCGASSGCSSGERSRMEELKSSFSSLVDSLGGNVRIGLGRFDSGSSGGYITYPVRGLDEPTGTLTAVARVDNALDDAVQKTSAAGDLMVSGTTIDFPSNGATGGRSGFVFRGLNLPRYAKVVSASLTMRSGNSNSSTALSVQSNYEVGQNLPEFVASNLFQRDWADSIGDVWQSPITFNVTEYWAKNKDQTIDVTSLVQRAIEDTDWCGGADMVLGFQGADSNTRRVYTADIDGAENAYSAKLNVTWTSQPLSMHPSPGTLSPEDYEKTLSCIGGQAAQIKSVSDDARQYNGDVNLGRDYVYISQTVEAAFRFADIPVDASTSLTYPDVVRKAVLYVTGKDAKNTNNSNITTTSPITIEVTGVRGNAAPILAANNNISNRNYVSGMAEYQTSPRYSDFVGTKHAIDVTDLVKEMISDGSWSRGGALMFRVAVDDNRILQLSTLEGGAAGAASLVMDVSMSTLAHLVPRVRDDLKAAVNGLSAGGGTPLGESYTEASRYMMGRPTYYGSSKSVAESKSGSDYISPLASKDQECASSHIVVMTDGQPSLDNYSNNRTADVMGVNTSALSAACNKSVTETGTGSTAELKRTMACMTELATWNLDAGKNTIKRQVNTHMVLFHLSATELAEAKKVTTAGEGQAVAAGSEAALANAFAKIVSSVTMSNATLAAPGVAVNQLNRIQHLDQLYFSVFKPSETTRWEGNVKRYRLGGTIDDPRIVDQNGADAINPNSGFFKLGASSWWTVGSDGDDVAKGGARGLITPDDAVDTRKLFVTLSAGTRGSSPAAQTTSSSSLTELEEFDDISAAKLGLPSGAIDELRKIRFETLMKGWGDPLHSVPRLVNYGYSGTAAEAANDASKQDNVIFASTNSGALHAINAKDGTEYFTFMPADELALTETRYQNANANPRATYGLDSSWTFWRRPDPANLSGVKSVYAYGGKRRGGKSYYALDLTNRSAPKMLWQIDREATGPFAKLGQTWSEPALAQVMIDDKAIPVLIFGGGYSPADHDAPGNVSTADAEGNAIYMVNARTGALVWWASTSATGSSGSGATAVPSMKWAIPANVTSVDTNFDGFVDHIYAADLGGQVFRVDVNKENTGTGSLVQRVERIASLGTAESAGIANHRRFFSAPSVALGLRNGSKVLQIAIGSGYRAGPLSEDTQDRIFALDDVGALGAASPSYATDVSGVYPIRDSNMVNVTSDASPASTLFNGKYGWYFNLEKDIGEKSLSKAAIIQGSVLMTTFNNESPPGQDKCKTVAGSARLYLITLGDGSPTNKNESGTNSHVDRYEDKPELPGIPPEPQPLLGALTNVNGGGAGTDDECPPGEECDPCEGRADAALTAIIGTSAVSLGPLQGCGFRKTRWYETDTTKAEEIFTEEGAVRP